MNRRGFLGSLAALVAVPFAPKVASKPSVPWMSDPLTRIRMRFIDSYDSAWAKCPGVRVGDTVSVPLPKRFTERDGTIEIDMTK